MKYLLLLSLLVIPSLSVDCSTDTSAALADPGTTNCICKCQGGVEVCTTWDEIKTGIQDTTVTATADFFAACASYNPLGTEAHCAEYFTFDETQTTCVCPVCDKSAKCATIPTDPFCNGNGECAKQTCTVNSKDEKGNTGFTMGTTTTDENDDPLVCDPVCSTATTCTTYGAHWELDGDSTSDDCVCKCASDGTETCITLTDINTDIEKNLDALTTNLEALKAACVNTNQKLSKSQYQDFITFSDTCTCPIVDQTNACTVFDADDVNKPRCNNDGACVQNTCSVDPTTPDSHGNIIATILYAQAADISLCSGGCTTTSPCDDINARDPFCSSDGDCVKKLCTETNGVTEYAYPTVDADGNAFVCIDAANNPITCTATHTCSYDAPTKVDDGTNCVCFCQNGADVCATWDEVKSEIGTGGHKVAALIDACAVTNPKLGSSQYAAFVTFDDTATTCTCPVVDQTSECDTINLEAAYCSNSGHCKKKKCTATTDSATGNTLIANTFEPSTACDPACSTTTTCDDINNENPVCKNGECVKKLCTEGTDGPVYTYPTLDANGDSFVCTDVAGNEVTCPVHTTCDDINARDPFCNNNGECVKTSCTESSDGVIETTEETADALGAAFTCTDTCGTTTSTCDVINARDPFCNSDGACVKKLCTTSTVDGSDVYTYEATDADGNAFDCTDENGNGCAATTSQCDTINAWDPLCKNGECVKKLCIEGTDGPVYTYPTADAAGNAFTCTEECTTTTPHECDTEGIFPDDSFCWFRCALDADQIRRKTLYGKIGELSASFDALRQLKHLCAARNSELAESYTKNIVPVAFSDDTPGCGCGVRKESCSFDTIYRLSQSDTSNELICTKTTCTETPVEVTDSHNQFVYYNVRKTEMTETVDVTFCETTVKHTPTPVAADTDCTSATLCDGSTADTQICVTDSDGKTYPTCKEKYRCLTDLVKVTHGSCPTGDVTVDACEVGLRVSEESVSTSHCPKVCKCYRNADGIAVEACEIIESRAVFYILKEKCPVQLGADDCVFGNLQYNECPNNADDDICSKLSCSAVATTDLDGGAACMKSSEGFEGGITLMGDGGCKYCECVEDDSNTEVCKLYTEDTSTSVALLDRCEKLADCSSALQYDERGLCGVCPVCPADGVDDDCDGVTLRSGADACKEDPETDATRDDGETIQGRVKLAIGIRACVDQFLDRTQSDCYAVIKSAALKIVEDECSVNLLKLRAYIVDFEFSFGAAASDEDCDLVASVKAVIHFSDIDLDRLRELKDCLLGIVDDIPIKIKTALVYVTKGTRLEVTTDGTATTNDEGDIFYENASVDPDIELLDGGGLESIPDETITTGAGGEDETTEEGDFAPGSSAAGWSVMGAIIASFIALLF